jgi:hypothetical protein
MNHDDGTWNMVSSHDGTTLKIDAHGSIEFTDDDADVKSISRGGYLTISKSTGRLFGDTQTFEARETGGTIERKYYVNGKALTGDDGRAVAADVPARAAARDGHRRRPARGPHAGKGRSRVGARAGLVGEGRVRERASTCASSIHRRRSIRRCCRAACSRPEARSAPTTTSHRS